jgi:hypothetical protein
MRLGWFAANGRPKEMSCRVALLRLHRAGLIELPAPRQGNSNGRRLKQITSISDPCPPILKTAAELEPLELIPVMTPGESEMWNQLIERYHYLGFKPLPGAQMRYLIRCADGLLAVIGFPLPHGRLRRGTAGLAGATLSGENISILL